MVTTDGSTRATRSGTEPVAAAAVPLDDGVAFGAEVPVQPASITSAPASAVAMRMCRAMTRPYPRTAARTRRGAGFGGTGARFRYGQAVKRRRVPTPAA